MGRKGTSEEKKQKIRRDYTDSKLECYHSIQKVADKHRVCYSTAKNALLEKKVTIFGRGRTAQVESKVKVKPNTNAVTKLTIDRIICEYTYIDGPYYMKTDALARKHYLEPQMLTDILIHEGVTDKYGRLMEGQGHHQAPPGESKKEVKPDKRVTPDEFYDKVFNNVKSELRKIFPKGTVITVSFDFEL